MEPIAYCMGMGNFVVAFWYFCSRQQDLDLPNLKSSMVQKYLNRLYEKNDFDIQNYKELERDIEKIRQLIAECV
jgi:hypothetical protein